MATMVVGPDGKRRCRTCGSAGPFGRHGGTPDGQQPHCKACKSRQKYAKKTAPKRQRQAQFWEARALQYPSEEWRPCGHAGSRLEVSSRGEVRHDALQGRVLLKVHLDRDGYRRVCIRIDGRTVAYRIGRLVCDAFVRPLAEDEQVNHIDGDKTNDTPANLEPCTQLHNQRHAWATGLKQPQRGESNGASKLTEDDVRTIRMMRASGISQAKVAARFGVSQSLVCGIDRRTRWSHVQ